MKKILVPMDFSQCAINAMRVAKELAKKLHCPIELVTSIHMPHLHAQTVGADSVVQPILSEYSHQIDENYRDLYEREGLNEIEFETKKFNSSVQNAIYSCIEQGDVGLVVSGTKENHDILEKILGGHTVDFISISKVPVLVIPEKVNHLEVRKIGLALNLEEEVQLDKLELVREFAKLFEAEINIMFIGAESEKRYIYDDNKVKLAEFFGDINNNFVNVKEHMDKSGKKILELVDELQLDMLYMHPKHHKLLDRIFRPSLTKQIAMEVDIPLLSVHE
ncbi:universal stress protein [Reichenbachiella ulvae]|uniref:Universal stress protein n=1 Tax=Reichenbachiella ulvae TaxID=2980104 RepID=A0ABT3CRE3_9BACT|nr:universal stress protein [Reichenbachiella ulvae]MCV9386253.1 universal stress protein [Reichenbachiella ulvae]